MTFEEPINPMRAMNNEWRERVEKMPALRFVGYTWDAVLVFLFILMAHAVLTDGSGLGLGAGLQGLLFTLGGLTAWALILALFFRPVGRGAILKVVAVMRFIQTIWRALFGSGT